MSYQWRKLASNKESNLFKSFAKDRNTTQKDSFVVLLSYCYCYYYYYYLYYYCNYYYYCYYYEHFI